MSPPTRRNAVTRWLAAVLAAPLLAGCILAPSPTPTPTPGALAGVLDIEVVAGPVCPVERNPPDPACAPRSVEGARILVQPGDGRDIVVAEAVTGGDGTASLRLPAGEYIVIGAEVEGLMGVPEPMTVTIAAGRTTEITLAYDTGIR